MAKAKFGFKTFIRSTHPIAFPRRPFNFKKDLTTTTKGLYIHLTPAGRVSKRTSGERREVLFCYYQSRDHEIVTILDMVTARAISSVPIECLHIDESKREAA